MTRAFNFSAGPATLPEAVLRQAQAELLEWQDARASIIEISHRSSDFIAVAAQAEADLRTLLSIPDEYAVLFLGGGATTQQALIPLNFAQPGQMVDYVITGHWGKTAIKQLSADVKLNIAASSEAGGFGDIPDYAQWQLSPDAAYVHITANETIHGVEFRQIPDTGNVPLIADFSSSIASEPMDISRYGVIYAGAQKNLGPVGITVVIIRRDLLQRSGHKRADIFNYRSHVARDSMLNTPPTWNWYLAGLVFRWMLDQGGLETFARLNQEKSSLIYNVIDQSGGFYQNKVNPAVRSRMNIPFFLPDTQLESQFISQAQQAGLLALKGHKAIGGIRASLYNAMPLEGAQALANFMRDFQQRNG